MVDEDLVRRIGHIIETYGVEQAAVIIAEMIEKRDRFISKLSAICVEQELEIARERNE